MGRIPKRSDERQPGADPDDLVKLHLSGEVKAPSLPRGTHKIARDWYNSLKTSGQAIFYEPSDWQAALLVADQMTKMLNAQTATVFTPYQFDTIWKAMEHLLTTEAARRKAHIEIYRDPPEGEVADDSKPTALDKYRERLSS